MHTGRFNGIPTRIYLADNVVLQVQPVTGLRYSFLCKDSDYFRDKLEDITADKFWITWEILGLRYKDE